MVKFNSEYWHSDNITDEQYEELTNEIEQEYFVKVWEILKIKYPKYKNLKIEDVGFILAENEEPEDQELEDLKNFYDKIFSELSTEWERYSEECNNELITKGA